MKPTLEPSLWFLTRVVYRLKMKREQKRGTQPPMKNIIQALHAKPSKMQNKNKSSKESISGGRMPKTSKGIIPKSRNLALDSSVRSGIAHKLSKPLKINQKSNK